MTNIKIKSQYNAKLIKEAKKAGMRWDPALKIWGGDINNDDANWFLNTTITKGSDNGCDDMAAAVEQIIINGSVVYNKTGSNNLSARVFDDLYNEGAEGYNPYRG